MKLSGKWQKLGEKMVNTLFNKVLGKSEKCVFYFYLKTEGTFRPIQFSLLFKNVFIFNWTITASQYCIGLCCPLPLEPPPHIPPHPTPLGHPRAPSLSPCVTQPTPTGYLCHIR